MFPICEYIGSLLTNISISTSEGRATRSTCFPKHPYCYKGPLRLSLIFYLVRPVAPPIPLFTVSTSATKSRVSASNVTRVSFHCSVIMFNSLLMHLHVKSCPCTKSDIESARRVSLRKKEIDTRDYAHCVFLTLKTAFHSFQSSGNFA